ncbi:oxidoreductase [Emticicia sp. TH156]|uniref:oxidoreductase n=1 Tax=Emticicia sp. TH156 TaxID=2067454 RepID=UPI000C7795DC|nr:oxidoreductase [Emticicia sp. TH156]PLK42860.1 oxidoreductase [Emticicia sp. TH156]
MKTALIIGSTGLIGGHLTQKLINHPAYSKVKALVRKPLSFQHPKLEQIIVDFDHLDTSLVVADDIFCCLGTTMKQAGSKEAFYKVDFTYPFEIAKAALKNGARQYFIVTAMGANANSVFYYNRVKGEIERSLTDLHFPTLVVFQPSLLLGERKESRAGEGMASVIMKGLDFLIPAKYKAIKGETVANAMITIAQRGHKGKKIVTSAEMQSFASITPITL